MLFLRSAPLKKTTEPSFEIPSGMSIAKRTPRSLGFLKHYQEGNVKMNVFNPFIFESADKPNTPIFLLGDADLWKPLTAAYGKCDGMVDGKYHGARLFSFESQNFYFFCRSETGDRGTSWYISDKSKPLPHADGSGFCSYFKPNPDQTKEALHFFDDLLLGMALAHPQTMEELKDCFPCATAAFEALALGKAASIAEPKKKQRKLRV